MKISTKKVLKNLKGEELKTQDSVLTLGEAVSNCLLQAKEGGKMKLYVLAQKFFEHKITDIDEADLSLVKRTIETSEGIYNALVLGQILQLLEEVKESK